MQLLLLQLQSLQSLMSLNVTRQCIGQMPRFRLGHDLGSPDCLRLALALSHGLDRSQLEDAGESASRRLSP